VALQSLCLPIRLGGFGLRRISVVSPAAFWSAVAQAVPDITALIPDAHRAAKLHHPSSMIPLAREIDYCHRTLLESLGPDSPLPAHVDGFWQLYAGGQCRGLQRTLCVSGSRGGSTKTRFLWRSVSRVVLLRMLVLGSQ